MDVPLVLTDCMGMVVMAGAPEETLYEGLLYVDWKPGEVVTG